MCSTLGRGSKKKATMKLGQQIYKTHTGHIFFPSNEMNFEDD